LKIDTDAFHQFCQKTIDIYFDPELGAPWYPMTPTLHRILFHGKDLIDACPVPIGWTSEECSEANNKFARDFELNHSRKTSNEDNFMDLFHRLIDISDPVLVTSSIKEKHPRENDMPPDMLKLIQFPTEDVWKIKDTTPITEVPELNISDMSFEDIFNCSLLNEEI
jgi:hypothetical protein